MSNIFDHPRPKEPRSFFVHPPEEHIIMTPQGELDSEAKAKEHWQNEAFKKAMIKLAE